MRRSDRREEDLKTENEVDNFDANGAGKKANGWETME